MQFWSKILQLEGQTLKTLDKNKIFDIVCVTERSIILNVHASDKDRLVHHDEIEGAYKELFKCGQITRNEIQKKYSPRNPAYVAAILSTLPGVQHSLNPITLIVSLREAK